MSSLIAALLITLCEVRPVIDSELVLYTFAVAFAFPPFQTSIHYGQPTALLLLLLIAAWSRSRRGDDIGAGIFLASAVLLKAFPWVMAGYFVSQRRWRVLVSAAIFSGFCGGAVVAVYGLRCSLDFLTHTRVAAVWLDRPRNLSVLANAHQMIYRLNSIGVVWQQRLTRFLVIAVDLTLILTSFIATSWSNDKTSWSDGMCWSLWVLTTILLAPVAWDHYWVLILPLWPFSSVYLRISSAEGAIARSGLILIACGFLGFFIVPYVQTLKDLHLYFFLTLSSNIGICI
jgi:alpha-1,2-mannosyltransferase